MVVVVVVLVVMVVAEGGGNGGGSYKVRCLVVIVWVEFSRWFGYGDIEILSWNKSLHERERICPGKFLKFQSNLFMGYLVNCCGNLTGGLVSLFVL